ncbi:hypothetical protein T02_10962 [Trichinella nativa]|uniref:Uncharacterized protein n=1 Tax=Trichinella nativa TaxID=6335 RepID=A0A0V1LSA4_9BILA|nr:hypothetical protein T02_10962 [Trichinella nativa]
MCSPFSGNQLLTAYSFFRDQLRSTKLLVERAENMHLLHQSFFHQHTPLLTNSTNDAPREERQPNSVNPFVISVTVFFSVNMLLFSPGCWFETSLKDQKCDFATVLYITFLFKVSAVVFYFCSLSAA